VVIFTYLDEMFAVS